GAHLRFGEISNRESGVRQLRLSQREEKVALILRLIAGSAKMEAFGVRLDSSVVASGELGTERSRSAEQEAEFDVPIARHAGDRRSSVEVGVHERTNYLLLKNLLHVRHVKGNAQVLSHRARIVDVLRAAATSAASGRVVGPDSQRHADHLVA